MEIIALSSQQQNDPINYEYVFECLMDKLQEIIDLLKQVNDSLELITTITKSKTNR